MWAGMQGSRVVGAGLWGRVLDDPAQAKPPAGPRIHDEGVVAELALQIQATCEPHARPVMQVSQDALQMSGWRVSPSDVGRMHHA